MRMYELEGKPVPHDADWSETASMSPMVGAIASYLGSGDSRDNCDTVLGWLMRGSFSTLKPRHTAPVLNTILLGGGVNRGSPENSRSGR